MITTTPSHALLAEISPIHDTPSHDLPGCVLKLIPYTVDEGLSAITKGLTEPELDLGDDLGFRVGPRLCYGTLLSSRHQCWISSGARDKLKT